MQAMIRTSPFTLAQVVFWSVALVVVAVANPVKVLPDGTHRVVLSIPEMECPVCCSTVRIEVGRVKGVREIRLDEAHRIATVRFDPAQTCVKALQDAIKRAGMDSTPIDGNH